MGFLGGLAGTLGQILQTQDAEQRRESAMIRSEDRAALRKFNSEGDNVIQEGDKWFAILKGKDGNVIAKRELTTAEVEGRSSDKLKKQAGDIEAKDVLATQKAYEASGSKLPKSEWLKSLDEKRANDTWKERNLTEYNQARGLASMRRAADREMEESDYDKLEKELVKGVLKGTYAVEGGTPAKMKRVATEYLKGSPKARSFFRHYIDQGKLVKAKSASTLDDTEDNIIK